MKSSGGRALEKVQSLIDSAFCENAAMHEGCLVQAIHSGCLIQAKTGDGKTTMLKQLQNMLVNDYEILNIDSFNYKPGHLESQVIKFCLANGRGCAQPRKLLVIDDIDCWNDKKSILSLLKSITYRYHWVYIVATCTHLDLVSSLFPLEGDSLFSLITLDPPSQLDRAHLFKEYLAASMPTILTSVSEYAAMELAFLTSVSPICRLLISVLLHI